MSRHSIQPAAPEEYLSGYNDTRIMENPSEQQAFVNRLKKITLQGNPR